MKYRNLINEIINENVNKKLNEGWFSKNKDKKEEPKQEEPKKEEPKQEEPKPKEKTEKEIKEENIQANRDLINEKLQEFKTVARNMYQSSMNLSSILSHYSDDKDFNYNDYGYPFHKGLITTTNTGNADPEKSILKVYDSYIQLLYMNNPSYHKDIKTNLKIYKDSIDNIKNYLKEKVIPIIQKLKSELDNSQLSEIIKSWNNYKKSFDSILSYVDFIELKIKELNDSVKNDDLDFGGLTENRIRKIVKEEFIKLYKKKRSL